MLDCTTAADRRGMRLALTAVIAAATIPTAILIAAGLGAPPALTGAVPGELGIMPILLVAGAVWQFAIRPHKQFKAPRR